MNKLIECVPNFSEGRDKSKIDNIVKQMSDVPGITVLDVDPGQDTNRTVVTIVGAPEAIAEAAFQGIKRASEVLDMGQHSGTHPRMGATDVCPFIPVSNITIEECVDLSKQVGKRVGDELGIPIFLYEKSAQKPDREKLPTIRKGEYEGLSEKLKDGNWQPDFGPAKLHVKAGATVMGCREFLIAYNINLNTKDHRLATDIAFELREAGRSKRSPNPDSKNLLDGEIIRQENGKPVKVPGMFKDVKGIGWYVELFNRAQISINFNNYKVSTIHDVFDAACKLAEERGIRVTGSELVGLIPLEAMIMAGKYYLKKQNRSLGVPTADIVECAVQSLGLNDVTKFDPQEKIIDYAVQSENRPLMSLTGTGFVKELSTNSPAPGGGSVAALAGALGAALSSMVAALTHEKKEMLETKPEMDIIGVEAQTLKDRLTFLVDEDTEAFNKVMDANRMAATNDNEQKIKDKAVEVANKYAIEIPMETAEKCFRVIELAEILVEKGNPNSVSDAGVAAEVALAGVSGACMNVLINLPGIEDEDYCDSKRDQVETIMEKAESLEKIVFEKTMDVINK
ncbi:MAG: glutamate formimidoyltransferase [Candidatus Marinimicrobia bacterium]|jgi:glutamate formiminotransferase/formiminotetrahydrofolate cyclodeaminase|nr:glutamate formimidoyltransferase [Candidatus Neomarinimicrobiota bacterium]MBT4154848.1 glutamate formimidoyltransferase [Candidatus Neomarinimicrobiota bacterium]MBT4554440.1 glutamate formimidoyltransferase [Candidatus Neomarinimicrobiota bacterium]MBT4752530.1 glutamate formimidoyltransferase [Candidatus Neomarinimicrobiota bacterium]MBT5116212.1 glutamate formimidoyltransferase [Candidatus Neomarinimicrobiota bacterium]|tara:strand:+ start:5091 stop:6791 length:1701 start_codon:yes stop_codon:yes gene_type:complete